MVRGKKGKYQGAEKFIKKMKEIQEEAKAMLGKAQEEIKKYTDRKRGEADNYKVENLVMLSTKDLKYQMVERRTEKLTERFVDPYKIKKIVLLNAVELELPSTVKIHLVVNVSRIQRYIGQVEGCHDLANRLSHYLYFFSFSFLLFFLSMDARENSDSYRSTGL